MTAPRYRSERAPLHPICLSFYPIASAYAHNLADLTLPRLPFDAILLPAAYSLMMTGLVWTLARVYIRNLRRAALFASLWSVAFFTFGRVAAVVPTWLVAVVWILIIVIAAWTLSLSRADTRVTTGILNLTSAAMLALPLATAALHAGVLPGGRVSPETRPYAEPQAFIDVVLTLTPLPAFVDGEERQR